ncbi:MAG: Asp-tRNA(Asn)/Glu-tRNA(Gln) amidotransferase GatCAB subunit [Deltaproteobacteria bacterium]|jgi:aspartyl-tRNA(Asn)/glutamyl-tRNA(Gln) amidotransferase subunit A|nr:Asp-tRNA(Asn)/Glu-tRNA(Gln) amidotransferase GatCAB subunit [Deltaproteobacteria bacterium]
MMGVSLMADDLCTLGIFELARLYREKQISPVEVVEDHLRRCDRLNPVLNAFLVIVRDSAMEAARAAESLFRAGVDLGPLQGVPVSVKDIIRVRGTRTTAASRVLLEEDLDQEDAVVVRRLRAAGAILIGKTNLHEFATGDPDPAGPFGLVQNPRLVGYHPGSSSSGAGAAAAAGLGVIAIGTDTGGSVRIPAYLCGVSGLKPTTGRIDLEGIIPLSWTLDTVGPLACRVKDVGAAWAVCAGRPIGGMELTYPGTAKFLENLDRSIRGWRLGFPARGFLRPLQSSVSAAYESTLRALEDLGCQLMDFDPPGLGEMPDLTMVITQAEGSAYHERYRHRDHLYHAAFRDRVFPGREMKALEYLSARRRQLGLQNEWEKATRGFDALIMPSGPAVAPPHGADKLEIQGQSFPIRAMLSRFTRPASLLGWPALSVPNGMSKEGLPTGVQFVGPPDSEERLLTLGHRLEEALGWVKKFPIEPRFPG